MFSKFFKSKKASPTEYKARATRVRLDQGDECRFVTESGQEYLVQNISDSGLALFAATDPAERKLAGTLFFRGTRLPLMLEGVRWNRGLLGCRVRDNAEYWELIQRGLNEEIKAANITEVSSSRLKAEPGQQPRWFFGSDIGELFLLQTDAGLTRVEFSFGDQYFVAVRGQSPRTGVIEGSEKDRPQHSKSELVRWHAEVNRQELQRAIRLIKNIPGISEETWKEIQALFQA